MEAIKGALEKMFAKQTWESLIAVVKAIMVLAFGIVAEDEDLEYKPL